MSKEHTNVVRFPIRYPQRIRNKLGKFAAPCEVSDRWLKFDEIAMVLSDDTEFLGIDVMTLTAGGEKEKKLCRMYVDRRDLVKILERVKTRKI